MSRIQIPGKWVLTGEHAVLTGGEALVLPHPEYSLWLEWAEGRVGSGFRIEPESISGVVRDLLGGLERHGGSSSKMVFDGTLTIRSSIPLGGGLGSSAALCVALVRWASPFLGVSPGREREIATLLENGFHGRSSGMDVAAASAACPIRFRMGVDPIPLSWNALPRFTFHDTGLRAPTKECVERVDALRRSDPSLATETDRSMGMATEEAIRGLTSYSQGQIGEGLAGVAGAMRRAQECFRVWGLLPNSVDRQISNLMTQGALAVKLTGAGAGGFLVALWPE